MEDKAAFEMEKEMLASSLSLRQRRAAEPLDAIALPPQRASWVGDLYVEDPLAGERLCELARRTMNRVALSHITS